MSFDLFPNLPPKIIELEQRTPEWHAWRRGEDLPDRGPRITASMIPQIIGASPWGNAYDLWMELTGRKAGKVSNYAMQRGIDLEPKARDAYTVKTGIEVRDICVEHPLISWLAASLDGYSLFGDTLAEIKCPGASDHATAVLNQVPSKYIPQTQWQLLSCPNAIRNHYWSYDGKEGVLVEVLPDRTYQEFLFRVALQFRQSVINDVPPDGEEFAQLALKIRQLYVAKNEAEDAYKRETARLSVLLPEYSKSASFGGVTVSRSTPEGRIDYPALVKDLQVPPDKVEAYRKQGKAGDTFRVTVTLDAVVPEFAQQAQVTSDADPVQEDQDSSVVSW